MTTISFPRPTKALLSMNDRHHWRRKAADVKAWRTAAHVTAAWHAVENGIPQNYPPSMVRVTLDVHDRRRRDPANYFPCVKAIVDGLVDAKFWRDDTPEYVTVCEPQLRLNAGVMPAGLMVIVELIPRDISMRQVDGLLSGER